MGKNELEKLLNFQREHYSDCAVHNAPAYPPGPCDCGAVERGERESVHTCAIRPNELCPACGYLDQLDRGSAVARRERPPIEPDDDGDCKRCGLGWSLEEIDGTDKHECPPGFLSK